MTESETVVVETETSFLEIVSEISSSSLVTWTLTSDQWESGKEGEGERGMSLGGVAW